MQSENPVNYYTSTRNLDLSTLALSEPLASYVLLLQLDLENSSLEFNSEESVVTVLINSATTFLQTQEPYFGELPRYSAHSFSFYNPGLMPLTISLTSLSSGLLRMVLNPGGLESSPGMPPYHIHLRAFDSQS